jgi:hypothetical protein
VIAVGINWQLARARPGCRGGGEGSGRQGCESSKVEVLASAVNCLYYRVARQPRGCPALSEPDGKVSLHPAQALQNASQRETRFRYGHTLTMNPVMALRMK